MVALPDESSNRGPVSQANTAATTPPIPPTAHEILRAIRRIVQNISVHSKHQYRHSGLTVPQLLCLRAVGLSRQPEVTATEVAREVQLTPATVTGILDRLERDGLITRERRSRDRRKICLSLTDAGREHMQLTISTLHDRFVKRLMSLDEQQQRTVLASLELVSSMIEAASRDIPPSISRAVPPIAVSDDASEEPSVLP